MLPCRVVSLTESWNWVTALLWYLLTSYSPFQYRTWCSRAENHGRLSHLTICWISARFRGHMTIVRPSPLQIFAYGELLAFNVVLYKKIILVLTTTECLLIVIFGVTSRSLIFRNDLWLFRKKLCDPVVTNCSDLKSQEVFMNGKLAFGKCNTYFNV